VTQNPTKPIHPVIIWRNHIVSYAWYEELEVERGKQLGRKEKTAQQNVANA
jgi:hypothetical protein